MKKIKKQSQKKSLNEPTGEWLVYKLLRDIFKKIFPTIPNIRLRLHMKDKPLRTSDCTELEKSLKLKQNLNDSTVGIGEKFQRHRWELKVNAKEFKRALAKYQRKNPNLDIYSEDIFPSRPIIQYLSYVVGIIAALYTIILKSNNTF